VLQDLQRTLAIRIQSIHLSSSKGSVVWDVQCWECVLEPSSSPAALASHKRTNSTWRLF
jgi:hypothetical protein